MKKLLISALLLIVLMACDQTKEYPGKWVVYYRAESLGNVNMIVADSVNMPASICVDVWVNGQKSTIYGWNFDIEYIPKTQTP